MLKSSINNAISLLKRIQDGVSNDQGTLKQILDQLHTLQTIPAVHHHAQNPDLIRITDSSVTPTPASPIDRRNENGAMDRLHTCGSDVISTGCDEETKFHV